MGLDTLESRKVCTTPKQKERMTRILDAARQAFAEHDFHDVLMDDVAREASVGKGTIYRYFPDKESLYFAVIFDGVKELKNRIRTAPSDRVHPEQTIRKLIFAVFSFLRQNSFFFRLMTLEDSKLRNGENPNRQRWGQERDGLIDAIAQVLVEAGEAGTIQVRHPRTEAQILMGMIRAVRRYDEDLLTIEQEVEEVSRIFLGGMRSSGCENEYVSGLQPVDSV